MSPPSSSSHANMLYCSCRHTPSCSKCGKPFSNRSDTKQAMTELINHQNQPSLSRYFGNGPLFLSDIPLSAGTRNSDTNTTTNEGIIDNCKDGVIVGIDEAGRGPVLGPMVYSAAYWNPRCTATTIPKGFNDSKELSDTTRRKLFKEILDHSDIGFCVRAFYPSELSRNMLRPIEPYNLNQMSHDAAIAMIHKLLTQGGVKIRTCYIDTVGVASHYQRKLEREFPGIEFVVESKADAKYPPCSAASVVAKVVRDSMMEQWKFSEECSTTPNDRTTTINNKADTNSSSSLLDFGSGYPSDPKCKKWMDQLQDPVFGYHDIVRFSWNPTKQRLAEKGISITFAADEDDDEQESKMLLKQQQEGLSSFLQLSGGGNTMETPKKNKKRRRLEYFETRNIQIVNDLL